MPSDEVRGELGAQLLESVDRTWRQCTEPNLSGSLQRSKEGPTHDLIWYSLEDLSVSSSCCLMLIKHAVDLLYLCLR